MASGMGQQGVALFITVVFLELEYSTHVQHCAQCTDNVYFGSFGGLRA